MKLHPQTWDSCAPGTLRRWSSRSLPAVAFASDYQSSFGGHSQSGCLQDSLTLHSELDLTSSGLRLVLLIKEYETINVDSISHCTCKLQEIIKQKQSAALAGDKQTSIFRECKRVLHSHSMKWCILDCRTLGWVGDRAIGEMGPESVTSESDVCLPPRPSAGFVQ